MNKIKVPFPAGRPMMVAGPTGCGKTSWVSKLLETPNSFEQPVASVLYCYGVFQPAYETMKKNIPKISFHKGVPKQETIDRMNNGKFHIVILDDLMELIVESIPAQMLFTKYCHHYNITAIFLTQNALAQGKCARNISLNTQILVLFQNHRDRNQVTAIARQQSPDDYRLFMEAFEDATAQPYHNLVVDCTPECENKYRWRTNVLPGEGRFKHYVIERRRKPMTYSPMMTIQRTRSRSNSPHKTTGEGRQTRSPSP